MANHSQVSVETFIENLQKLQIEAQRFQPADQPKMNRSDFTNYLNFQSIQIQQDAPNEKNFRRKKMNKKKKYQDDEDFNIDMESSGEKLTTVFPTQASDSSNDLNDTTIIFDQEEQDV